MNRSSLDGIRRTTRRKPYGLGDLCFVLALLDRTGRTDARLRCHRLMDRTPEAFHDYMQDGVLLLRCPRAGRDVVVLREGKDDPDADPTFLAFVGDADENSFVRGPRFGGLEHALSGIAAVLH